MVIIDAIGYQKSIASQIVAQRAGNVLAVKENQPSLLADIKDSFQMLAADTVDEQIDCGYGRVEDSTWRQRAVLTRFQSQTTLDCTANP